MTPPWLPTPAHDALLAALLAEGPRAPQFRQDLLAGMDLDAVDAGTHTLLPMLHRRLVEDGDAGPDAGRLQGIRRRSGYASTLLRAEAEPVLAGLVRAGIPCALIGAAAGWATIHRDEPALRPAEAVALLVAPDRAVDAARVVATAGFTPEPTTVLEPATRFRRGAAGVVELRTRVWRYQFSARFTDDVLARRCPAALGGTEVSTLDPTDHLLATVVAERPGGSSAPPVWALDAALLIGGGGIDWARLTADATSAGRAPTAAEGLAHLHDRFGLDVPAPTLAALRRAGGPWLGRRFERSERRDRTLPGRVTRAALTEYLFAAATQPRGTQLRRYPHWVLQRVRQRPWVAPDPV